MNQNLQNLKVVISLKNNSQQNQNLSQKEIEKLKSELKKLQDEVESKNKLSIQLKEELENARNSLIESQHEITTAKNEMNNAQEEVNIGKLEFGTISEDLRKANVEKLNLVEEKEKLLKNIEDLKIKEQLQKEETLMKEDEVKKIQEQVKFFKEILEKEVKEKEESVLKSNPEDLEKIKHLDQENANLNKKLKDYEDKINKLDQDNEFLQKLIQNKEEVVNLKSRYTYVSNLLTSVKNPLNADPQLINYAESVLSEGRSLLSKDEAKSLIPDEDLITLNRRMTNYQGEIDTYHLSKTQSKLILHYFILKFSK